MWRPMHTRNGRVMVPLYAVLIEDLGPVDFSVVECHSCNNVELSSGRFLLSLGFPPYTVLWPRGQRRSRHDRLPEYLGYTSLPDISCEDVDCISKT